jgi:hypothetical protein
MFRRSDANSKKITKAIKKMMALSLNSPRCPLISVITQTIIPATAIETIIHRPGREACRIRLLAHATRNIKTTEIHTCIQYLEIKPLKITVRQKTEATHNKQLNINGGS